MAVGSCVTQELERGFRSTQQWFHFVCECAGTGKVKKLAQVRRESRAGRNRTFKQPKLLVGSVSRVDNS